MPTSYGTPEHRLRAALNPQTEPEHTWVRWLIANLTPDEADVWSGMTERRVRTAVRSARMDLADEVLQGWHTDKVDAVQRMMHIATGGDVEQVDPSSDVVRDAHQRAVEVARSYDRGFAEGIEHARRQQAAGLDPELWRAE